MKNLAGKNVIITGCGSGLGREIARLFAREKSNIALIDINRESLELIQKELNAQGVKTQSYSCDISSLEDVKKVTSRIRNDFGGIDVLVNNAGIVYGRSFIDLEIDEMLRTMNVNFWGHVFFTKEILPEMVKRNSGAVVNIASAGGILGMPNLADYSASKFAEVGFTESLRRELKRDKVKGVAVTCVCPYIIDTGMFKGFKPLLFSPFIKPVDAAAAVIKAVKKKKAYVMLPPLNMFGMRLLKLLPASLFDAILSVVGGSHAMDSFVGRRAN